VRTIKLTVEYDGTELCGWQRQANGPTVQQHLEEALATMLGEHAAVTGASRTDSGVHAAGQVAHFVTSTTIPPYGFRRGLNSALPRSIAVVDAAEAPDGFHARFWARGKHYRYRVLTRRDRSPLFERVVWHRFGALDLELMRRAAADLIGFHDFAAFRSVECDAPSTTRRLTEVAIERRDELVSIDIHGSAFLRNMVRILAGTLVEIGAGRRDPESIAQALVSGDREDAGITAPAHGLCLMAVLHGDEPLFPRVPRGEPIRPKAG
jgi:tRNA pseudouridine38-40 synthase